MKCIKWYLLASIALFISACGTSTSVDVKPASESIETSVAKVSVSKLTIPKLSVQLWSVKDDIKADFDGTLTALADMGFDGVEFARYFGPYKNNPAALKALLDKLGLQVSAAHVDYKDLSKENAKSTADFYHILGAPVLIIAWDERAWDENQVDTMIAQLKQSSENMKPYAIPVGYHNHDQEFNAFNGSTFWDYIMQSTPDDIVGQLDVGWVTVAGKDPVEYVQRYPGRTWTTHYKAKLPKGAVDKQPIIGQDTIDWPALIKANATVGGTQWIVIEQEDYPMNLGQLGSVKASKQGLDKILTEMLAQ